MVDVGLIFVSSSILMTLIALILSRDCPLPHGDQPPCRLGTKGSDITSLFEIFATSRICMLYATFKIHLLLNVVYRDYPLCEIESGLNHMPSNLVWSRITDFTASVSDTGVGVDVSFSTLLWDTI